MGLFDKQETIIVRGHRLQYHMCRLAEAQVLGNGEHLGPVGSTIVAEVLIGLVRRSSNSILQQDGWTPSLPGAQPGTFTLPDLLRFAGVLAPQEQAVGC